MKGHPEVGPLPGSDSSSLPPALRAVPAHRLGIDWGTTAVKVAFVDGERLQAGTWFNDGDLRAVADLRRQFRQTVITGSGAARLVDRLGGPEPLVVDEFQATCSGARSLVSWQFPRMADRYALVCLGTGTSVFGIWPDRARRLGGTGVGGGTLRGLGHLFADTDNYSELVRLAVDGRRESVDLALSDVYPDYDLGLPPWLTAANFGGRRVGAVPTSADLCAGAAGMVAEVVAVVAAALASGAGLNHVVYAGGAVAQDAPLWPTLERLTSWLGLKARRLPGAAYLGAVGALTSGGETCVASE